MARCPPPRKEGGSGDAVSPRRVLTYQASSAAHLRSSPPYLGPESITVVFPLLPFLRSSSGGGDNPRELTSLISFPSAASGSLHGFSPSPRQVIPRSASCPANPRRKALPSVLSGRPSEKLRAHGSHQGPRSLRQWCRLSCQSPTAIITISQASSMLSSFVCMCVHACVHLTQEAGAGQPRGARRLQAVEHGARGRAT